MNDVVVLATRSPSMQSWCSSDRGLCDRVNLTADGTELRGGLKVGHRPADVVAQVRLEEQARVRGYRGTDVGIVAVAVVGEKGVLPDRFCDTLPVHPRDRQVRLAFRGGGDLIRSGPPV